MSTEIAVLRALLQLSRRSAPATLDQLVAHLASRHRREGEAVGDVQRGLASLSRAQLVLRSGETVRLSLAGLAVAVAATAQAKAASRRDRAPRSIGPSARVLPIRRRAA